MILSVDRESSSPLSSQNWIVLEKKRSLIFADPLMILGEGSRRYTLMSTAISVLLPRLTVAPSLMSTS